MLKTNNRAVSATVVLALILAIFSGCAKKAEKQSDLPIEKLSFRSIPGITQSEIDAIESLRKKYDSFVYGINPTTEAFIGKRGELEGYSIMFCDWLSDMFGIRFKPVFHQWGNLLRGLESGAVDFTGEVVTRSMDREGYFMSSPTIYRTIKSFRIEDSIPITEIMRTRKPRYGFLMETVVAEDIKTNTDYAFEAVIVDSHEEAYQKLKNGQIDSYFGLDTAEGAFYRYGDVISEEFFPLVFRSSCLATCKEELRPIISVLDKAIDDRVLEYLTGLQKRGYKEYRENRMYSLLTDEEHAFIQENPVIVISADASNYPISFFSHDNKWEGIYFEVLDEIARLTGLTFEIGNDNKTSLLNTIEKVELGEELILPELFHIKEYEGHFIWSDIPIVSDHFAIISRADFRNIDINDVFHLHVGVRRHTIYDDIFKGMFPAHRNFTEYDTMEETWEALRHGEVDVIFASQRRLVIYTNYYEQADFKLNLVFDHTFDSYFAFNKDAVILKSIVDKALHVVNVVNIANQWIYKTYDYRNKMAAAQRPWLIGAAVLFFFVLLLVTMLLARTRTASRQLEKLVAQRTIDLAFETSKLQAMIAAIPDFMFCKDTDFKYTQCNESFEQFMGFSEADILGKTNQDGQWFSSEDVAMIQGTDETVMNEGKKYVFEERIHSYVSGKEGFFETVKAPIRQDGVVIGIIAIVRDITQRKEMEKELALQTSLLKTMISSLPDAVFCKDLDYKYTLCNKFMADLFGKRPDDILGKDNTKGLGFSPEAAALAHDSDMIVANEHRQVVVEELIPCADGVTRLFETVKTPLVLDGTVIGIMAIGRDITRHKEMEKSLAFETSKLQAVFDSIPDLMFCKDTQLRYTQCNDSFEQFMGLLEENILGKANTDGAWFTPEEVEMIQVTDLVVIEENRTRIIEEKLRSPITGKQRIFETVKAPIRQDGAVQGIVAIVRDITQRKEMEEELIAASRAKSSFLAHMSHELRTPLNVVIGLTDLILEDDDRLERSISDNLVKISNAGNTLLSIVNDVLDFSKIESGKLTLAPVEYYVSSLLNDIVTLTVTRLGEKPIKFHLDINDDLPRKLYGDDLRVKQVFTNLLTNAIKYTREGSINLSIRCIRDFEAVWMEASVADTGLGILQEDMNNLFLDYYQVIANENRHIEGTGLGLPISKRLVEMMEGEINVESEYGKGSKFSFRIKQGFVNDTPMGADVSEKLRNFCFTDEKRIITRKLVRIDMSYAKVLVVDDMETNLDVASGLLRRYKMQVDCLTSGPVAIERIRAGTPVYNAIFMDHMMPGMDGIETADRIRALGTEYAQKIPIIALTANAIQGTEKMFYAHDFQAFITKPIDVMELDTVLRRWVRDDTHEEVVISAEPSEEDNLVIEIPGVDTEKALSLYVGEKKVYLPLLRSYITNTPKVLDKLRSVSAENLSDYVIAVHGLKGTSAGIGAEAVREAAFELEQKSRAGDLQGVLEKNDKLIADTEIIVSNVKEWLEKNDIQKAKPKLKAPDRELLEQLRQSCESYDVDDIEEVMSKLESNDYEEDAELITWLREKIDISKMGEVAKRLETL